MAHDSSLLHAAREFFVLRDSERLVGGYAPGQHARVREHYGAAERRLAAGRNVALAVPAALLFREAVSEYLAAIDAARGPATARPEPFDPVAALPPVPSDPIHPEREPTNDHLVRAALAARSPLYFDTLDADEAERARRALERAAAMLRKRVEARSLVHLRASRVGRLAALTLVVGYFMLAGFRAAFLPTDIALGKPVHSSSRKHVPPDGHALVDGVVGGGFALHTNTEDSPWAVIDLAAPYFIDRIVVYNRTDGWFDDCLPLVVEVSTDGSNFAELARRTEHFSTDPPWSVDGHERLARYVRLRVARRSYLALSEVKVFGREEPPEPGAERKK